MKKVTIASILAVASLVTMISPVAISAAETTTTETEELVAEEALPGPTLDADDEEYIYEATLTTLSDTVPTEQYFAASNVEGGYIPEGNEYTYIGVLEDAYKRQVYIRIPYWFSNTFPGARWYFIGKNKLQVRMTVYPKTGTRGKRFGKKITLPRDSRLWLGGWGDYNNELIVPPWLQAAFRQEATTVGSGTDPDLGNCTVIALHGWKNKKAFQRRRNPIVKVIHYVDYNHYRVTTTTQYAGNTSSDGGTIIID